MIHSASRMASRLIAQIEFIVLWHVGEVRYPGRQFSMLVPRTALASVRGEGIGAYANWRARATTVAIGAVRKNAAAAKTVLDQFRIDVRIDKVGRRGYLRSCLPPVEVTAGIGGRCIELQGCERQVFKVRHVFVVRLRC